MENESIPENIRRHKPGPNTEIKLINGIYYVYIYRSAKLANGNWLKKSGKCIGRITAEKGFIPNRNYTLYPEEKYQAKTDVLEYGQYAVVEEVARDIRTELLMQFPPEIASQVFAFACLWYVSGFSPFYRIETLYKQSWLMQEYKKFSFSMDEKKLEALLANLGRMTNKITNYELVSMSRSSSVMVLDSYLVGYCSRQNSSSDYRNTDWTQGQDPVSLYMGYDLISESPLFSGNLPGFCRDSSIVKDLNEKFRFSDTLCVLNIDFYSEENLKIFSENGNSYIVQVPVSEELYQKVMRRVQYSDMFYGSEGHQSSPIEYASVRISDFDWVYIYRDKDENERDCAFYLRNINLGNTDYTLDEYVRTKESFGVYVLQSNSGLSPEEIFRTFKKSSSMVPIYKYIENRDGSPVQMLGDDESGLPVWTTYDSYKEKGMSFFLEITGQIHQKMTAATTSVSRKRLTVVDILLLARSLMLKREGKTWRLVNAKKQYLSILKQVGFIPIETYRE